MKIINGVAAKAAFSLIIDFEFEFYNTSNIFSGTSKVRFGKDKIYANLILPHRNRKIIFEKYSFKRIEPHK